MRTQHRHPTFPTRMNMHWIWFLLLLGAGVMLTVAACGPRTPLPSASPAQTSLSTLNEVSTPPVVDVRQVQRALTASESENYLGDSVCAPCHPGVAAIHARSAHANTLRPVSMTQDG